MICWHEMGSAEELVHSSAGYGAGSFEQLWVSDEVPPENKEPL